MPPYIVITTATATYKCHAYRMKNDRVYFNGRAVNKANIATIVLKDGSEAYSNGAITPYNARKLTTNAVVKAKESKTKPKKKSSLPDVIEI